MTTRTSTPPAAAGGPVPASAWGSARLLAGTTQGRVDLTRHRAVHGMPRLPDAAGLARMLGAVHLLGRGGAGFPVATKLRGMRTGARAHVLVNGSEGEPASRKDRALLSLAPHLVLDGALAIARALETEQVTVVVADPAAYDSLAVSLRERPDARSVRLVPHDQGFVAGEVRSVVRALSGGPAVPPGRRTLPTEHGIDGRPTFASNAETFAQIALVLTLGVEEYAAVGTPEEPGTTLLTLLGDVPRAGVVEVPTGLPLAALVGAGHGEAAPVLVGGYHGTWVAGPGDLTVSRPALRQAGVPLNAGVLARLPQGTCALGEVATVAAWLASESSGQCGPCYFGLPSVADALVQLAAGRLTTEEVRRRAGLLPGRGACAHPDGAAAFVASALPVLEAEIAVHRAHGHCGRPLLGALPTTDPTPRRAA
ncbi:NADH-quinone oxidoreductase subunit I [Nocardioides sp. GY 10113]|uniref:NADH-ubiquinone oxidoreductase-F iron-sulfur binding region domain-containing protein n=1 Tax=Nocardioides sp. GY 10113 TaxID=2569761 RepID=UPI0010A8FDD6|nr:NADH-ubiquinone oxidoreductase-F iron-sulfur binding region domain-containing protein [Nocardioides sp. GY 10113]TIC88314.1 NADH-quinone oxidoreductase subunit I [Nocardioides sp. GY 10113]